MNAILAISAPFPVAGPLFDESIHAFLLVLGTE
jgi:hypothetical protein